MPRSNVPGTILIPERVLVNRPGKAPYFTTRYKRAFSGAPSGARNIHVIQSGSWHGDRGAVLEAWTKFVGSKSEEERQHLTVPIVAMQEIYYQNHKGLFAVLGNRIVGVVSYKNVGSDEMNISMVSPAPYDLYNHRIESINRMLLQAIRMKAEKSNRHITGLAQPGVSALNKWVEDNDNA